MVFIQREKGPRDKGNGYSRGIGGGGGGDGSGGGRKLSMYSVYEFRTKQIEVNQRPSRDSTTTLTSPSRRNSFFSKDEQGVERGKRGKRGRKQSGRRIE